MDEKPAAALRHKAESSMALAIQSHQQGNSGAMVSAGNTAALVAFGLQILDSLPGVNRPALCCAMPHRTGRTWMLDMGATLEPEPDQLVQFARMGSCLAQINEGLERPRVGLLNVGSENGKGTSAVRDLAAQLESCADIYYCGFAEGVDICSGRFDVIVCEGFAGNVALKAAEGVSSYIGELVADFRRDGWVSRFAMLLLRKRLQALGRRIDPAEFNGAPLLGLGGLIIKSRGGTNTRGFATAIALAAEMARSNVLARMEEYMGV
jgi:glycerol-3-phosphate acyltransferase PlsX